MIDMTKRGSILSFLLTKLDIRIWYDFGKEIWEVLTNEP